MIVMNLFVAISIEAYKKLARDDKAITAKPETPEDTETPMEGAPNADSNTENGINAGIRTSKDKSVNISWDFHVPVSIIELNSWDYQKQTMTMARPDNATSLDMVLMFDCL